MPITEIKDPFDILSDELAVQPPSLFARPSNGDDYIWNGMRLPRVTAILSAAPGQSLMHYYSKVAALAAAAALVHAGLYTPAVGASPVSGSPEELDEIPTDADEIMAQLEKYVDCEPMRALSPADAIAQACNWADNMKAPDRYRDHKARIGSLAHLYKHYVALSGDMAPPTVERLAGMAEQNMVVPDDVFARFAQFGKTRDEVLLDLAHHALPHAQNVREFIEKFRPEYEAVGTEAMVGHRSVGYAGTLDDWAVYSQDRWRANMDGKWPFDPALSKARILGDLKTSNSLARTVRYQLAAYARAEFVGDFATQTEITLPEMHGVVALHSVPGEGIKLQAFSQSQVDVLFDGFAALTQWYQALRGMPRASAGRKATAPPKGHRPSPIATGVR